MSIAKQGWPFIVGCIASAAVIQFIGLLLNQHWLFWFVGLAWLEDVADRSPKARETFIVAIVSALAACLTPFGPLVWIYAAGLSTNAEVTERIGEWQPTSLRTIRPPWRPSPRSSERRIDEQAPWGWNRSGPVGV